MKLIKLNNELYIPEIGFGTHPQKETLVESAEIAYRVGYRLFDTSDNYYNEEFLGQAVSANSQHFENSIFISKFSQANRTDKLAICFDESAKKLCGKLDIFLLHWPYPFLWKEQWRKMEKLYIEGKCKGIGVCNFEVDKLKTLLSFCKVKPIINQIERHPLFQQQDIVDFCKQNDIQVISYSPTARQDRELYESYELKQLANKYNKTVNQIILRWNIDSGTIPIPGSKSEKHIKENFDIDDFYLSPEDIEKINALECGKRIRFDPKKRFRFKSKVKFALLSFKILIGRVWKMKITTSGSE